MKLQVNIVNSYWNSSENTECEKLAIQDYKVIENDKEWWQINWSIELWGN